MASIPTPQEILYEEQHITDTRQPSIVAANVICLIIACAGVGLRIVSRRMAKSAVAIDDVLMYIALTLFIAFVTCALLLVRYGEGRHIILLTQPRLFVIFTMCSATLYNTTICVFKLSILFLYARIFPLRWFRNVLIAVSLFVIATAITFVFTTIFQCLPINSQWQLKPPVTPPRCISYPDVILAASIINTVTSVIILCLPIPLIWKLNISKDKRRLIIGVFALGGGECFISIARCAYAHTFKSNDATYNNVTFANLTTAELGVGILCACVPVYRPLISYIIHHSPLSSILSSSARSNKKLLGSSDYNKEGASSGHSNGPHRGQVGEHYYHNNGSKYSKYSDKKFNYGTEMDSAIGLESALRSGTHGGHDDAQDGFYYAGTSGMPMGTIADARPVSSASIPSGKPIPRLAEYAPGRSPVPVNAPPAPAAVVAGGPTAGIPVPVAMHMDNSASGVSGMPEMTQHIARHDLQQLPGHIYQQYQPRQQHERHQQQVPTPLPPPPQQQQQQVVQPEQRMQPLQSAPTTAPPADHVATYGQGVAVPLEGAGQAGRGIMVTKEIKNSSTRAP